MPALLLLAAVAVAQAAAAQTPDTDIYLVPLLVRDGWVAVGQARNITGRAGYDNQPHFTADGRAILYTARLGDAQTDIFRYDLRSQKNTRLTQTSESEYSPTPSNRGFSVIRVERDSAQRLWRFDSEGNHPALLLAGVRPVGYHAWLDPQRLVLFVLGSPATLQLADLRNGQAEVVARDIGRSIQKIPRWNGVSYVQRQDSVLWVRRLDRDRTIHAIAQLPPGGEYHAWTPRRALLATAGSRLLEWTPMKGGTWRQVADFTPLGLRVSRLAVSPNGEWIALVGERVSSGGGIDE
jgi:hypothetical protein